MTSVLKSAVLQNYFFVQLYFLLLPIYTKGCWQLIAFASVYALMLDMLVQCLLQGELACFPVVICSAAVKANL